MPLQQVVCTAGRTAAVNLAMKSQPAAVTALRKPNGYLTARYIGTVPVWYGIYYGTGTDTAVLQNVHV